MFQIVEPSITSPQTERRKKEEKEKKEREEKKWGGGGRNLKKLIPDFRAMTK